jgi:hypothetical protein
MKEIGGDLELLADFGSSRAGARVLMLLSPT